jgi:hypothetical protein
MFFNLIPECSDRSLPRTSEVIFGWAQNMSLTAPEDVTEMK